MLRPIHSMFAESEQRRGTDRLLRLWLLPTVRSRLRFVRSLLAPDPSFPPREEAPDMAGRLVKLIKLGFFQVFVYLRAAACLATRRGRDQMRFWSRNARSSDRR